MSAVTPKAARPRRSSKPPVYVVARELIDPVTNERVMALRPATHSDAEQPAWKRMRPGDRRRCELTSPRNPGFHALAHRIAMVATRNVEELSHLDPHHAFKRLQAEAGVECDVVMLDAATMWEKVTEAVVELLDDDSLRKVLGMVGELMAGRELPVQWPRSIAFDSMDEDQFRALTQAICRHLARRYWPTCTPEQIALMAQSHIDGA